MHPITLLRALAICAFTTVAACGDSQHVALSGGAAAACTPPQTTGVLGEGTECRQWVTAAEEAPPSLSPATYRFTTRPASIPMRDGAMLSAVLYLPVLASGEVAGPCVWFAEGYAPPSAIGGVTGATAAVTLEDLARRGYGGAYVHLRGSAPEGESLYYKYMDDGYDVTEWLAQQEFCDARIGMIGASLNGISQWLAAKALPPSLKAIVPEIGCGDCWWFLWNKGGTRPGSGRMSRTPPITAYDEYAAGSAHPDYDAWWSESRNTDAADHARIAAAGIAVMQCGGWDDYIFAGGVRAVADINRAGGHGMQLIGECAHGGPTYTTLPYNLATYRVLWFDRWLKGIANGVDTGPRALFYVEGANLYRYEADWPVPDARPARLYLSGTRSGTVTSLNDGSLLAAAPARGASSASYDYSPNGPFNSAGGGTTRPTADQRGDEANSLTWTSAPLRTHTEITGWPRVVFWASSTAADTDFVFELTEVTPEGLSTTISRGWLNGPRALDRVAPPPLAPGEVYRFELEMWPLAHVFRAGNRIRLDLAGSDNPGTDPNPLASTVTVYQDASRASYVEVPIVGTARLPGE
jgi:uncharacterized protein